jgi:4-diphosphocytidyl-2-C-methyl-D-erythritol kinase
MALLELRAVAPAKVNLVLRVGPRRADGYHDLATLLVPLDLCDELRVRVWTGQGGPIGCRVPGRPDLDGPGNLAARAAEALRLRFGLADRISILLRKRIPVTAGLGGGSSDAAAVIRCLARAYGVRSRQALAQVALSVGSDVPFFLGSGAAWATGRGERLRPARVPALDFLIAYPSDPALAIRAGQAYAWLDAARGIRASGRERAPKAGFSGARLDARRRASAIRQIAARLANDLEAPCLAHRPPLERLRRAVAGAGSLSAILSGSGPAIFGLFGSRGEALRGASVLRRSVGPGVALIAARSRQRLPPARAAASSRG